MPKREASIPVAAWWYEAARRELGTRSITWLAAEVGDSISNVSRCLSGHIPTLRLLIRISDRLRVPRPVFLPQTEAEALALHGALALRALDAEITQVEQSVSDDAEARRIRDRTDETSRKGRRSSR